VVLGIKRRIDKRPIVAIRSDGFADLVTEMGSSDEILDLLAKKGALNYGGGTVRTHQIKVKGWPGADRPRFYLFDLKVLQTLAEKAS
jgi:hypothetical protein